MTLSEVEPGFQSVGQAVARTIAQRAAAGDRLRRTLLVHGPPGAGKGAFVDDLLALIFCTHRERGARPCNACHGCRTARGRSHPDLLIGSPDQWREERSTGESIVAAARRWLLASAGAPVAGEVRVILIEDADRANEQIQNAMLKMLEEPGPRQMFILVSDQPGRLLPTIRSRAQPLRIGPVPRAELAGWLIDRIPLPADQADALVRLAGGLAGRAIGYARDFESVTWRRRTQEELLSLLDRGPADRFAAIRELLDDAGRRVADGPPDTSELAGDDATRTTSAAQRRATGLLAEAWIGLTRDLLVAAAGRPRIAPSAEFVTGLEDHAARIGMVRLRRHLALLLRIREGLLQSAAPRLAMEVAMLSWTSG